MRATLPPWFRALLLAGACVQTAIAQPQPPALERAVSTRDPAAAGIGRTLPDLRATTLSGEKLTLEGLLKGRRALVIAMTGAGCPVSRGYAPRLAALESAYANKGVAFLYVAAVDAETTAELRDFAREFGIRGSIAIDPGGDLRRGLRARTTTEVFVLTPGRVLRYRGAVDDQYRVGGVQDRVREPYLRDALDALLEGHAPRTEATSAPGCLLDLPPEPAPAPAPKSQPQPNPQPAPAPLTFYPDIARVLSVNCVPCHRDGGPAPFSLERAGSVEGRATMIQAVIRAGLMPPTHAPRHTPDLPSLVNHDMPADDKALLLAWLDSPRDVGDATKAPPPPSISSTWTIGRPDAIIFAPHISLPLEGPLQNARLAVPLNFDQDRELLAVECRPMMRHSVHHALIWVIPPGGSVPGPQTFPPSAELLTAFSPVEPVRRWDPAHPRLIPKGSSLAVDLYARPTGRPSAPELRIAFTFADPAPNPKTRAQSLLLLPPTPAEPLGPGVSAVSHGDGVAIHGFREAQAVTSGPVRVRALTPYLRARGVELQVSAHTPDGQDHPLLALDRYDFRWMLRYELQTPIEFPAGTVLRARAAYDNSAANPANPNPAAEVPFGSGALDEALFVEVEFEPVPDAKAP